MNKATEKALENIKESFDKAIYDLPLDEAIEAAEELSSHVEAVLDGMRADMSRRG